MTQKQLIEVVSKSFGLYVIVQTFISFEQIFLFVVQLAGNVQGALPSLIVGIADVIFRLLSAWFLVFKSEFIADKLIRTEGEPLNLNVTKPELIELVIIAIGMLLIVNAIPEFLNKVSHFLYFNEFDREEKNMFWTLKNRKADILFSVFKFAAGLITMTNGRLIAKALTR